MFILHKSSRITCNSTVLNQCKDVAHAEYDYDVKLFTGDQLDSKGFVIDHSEIHRIVKNVFDTKMGSCEQLTSRIGNDIRIELEQLRIYYSKIEVCVRPVGSNAFITYIFLFKQL